MKTVILHADLDAFYASVEQLDAPHLCGKPVIVGGLSGTRGVVSACSYEARAFGVHSAMPMVQARKCCPHAIFLPVRMARYQELSRTIMAILSRYTPSLRQISVDEAFIDASGTEKLFGPAPELAEQIRREVRAQTSLAITIGIAPNRYLAKMASAAAKPDGLLSVSMEEACDFIDRRGISRLWGFGTKTLEQLARRGIRDTTSLRSMSLPQLASLFGQVQASFMHAAVRGEDPGIFNEEVQSSSIGIERTFPVDIHTRDILETILLELSEELAYRLHCEGGLSRTLQVKLRRADFVRQSIQETRSSPFTSAQEIWLCACKLLAQKLPAGQPLRLLGLSLQDVNKEDGGETQGELFERDNEKMRRVEAALSTLRSQKGLHVTRARLLERPSNTKTPH